MILIISFINTFFILILSLFFVVFLLLDAVNPVVVNRPTMIENKGIYLTAYTAGNSTRMAELVDLIRSTELNSVVIDVKDYSGRIFFDTDILLVNKIGSEEIRLPDLKQLLANLKKEGIYSSIFFFLLDLFHLF